MKSHASLFVLAALFATSALAQQAPGMVNVDLGTVANTIAKNIKVEPEKIPASVHLPVALAATTCGVPAAKLTAGDMASCQATTSSPALEQMVATQVKAAPKQ